MRKEIILTAVLYLVLCFVLMAGDTLGQWQPEVNLTNDVTSSYTSFGNARCVAANGDVIHVVWYDGDSVGVGNWEIYYKRSSDNGATWSEKVNLSNNDALSYNAAIAVSGNTVHVVWYDKRDGNYEEYYKRSQDGGITWEPEVRLTYDAGSSSHCSVFADGLNVYLVWHDNRDGNLEIYFKKSVDGGSTWTSDLRLSNTAFTSYMPAVAVSGKYVHVVWYDSTAGNWEIYYKRSVDGGINWGPDSRLTNNSFISNYPTLAVSGAYIHVFWSDTRDGNISTYYKRSSNNGTNWGADTRVVKLNFRDYTPSVAVNGSTLHLVFYRLYSTGYDIFYMKSSNNGTKWGNDVQLTSDPLQSTVPSVAVSGSSVHVIFRDFRDGNSEIYYKRYISSPRNILTGIENPEAPAEFKLKQNYPNPFNPVTAIGYDIAKSGFVSVKIFDMLGREVASLVNENKQAGSYNINWDASKMQSGVYFCKIIADGFTDVKKMMLVK